MPQPPDQPPAPITLEYQRLAKRRKRAVGGLLMFSGFLCLLVLIVSGAMAIDTLLHAPQNLLFTVIAVAPITVTGTYFTMAILFHRGVKWAGWVALAISALIAIGLLFLVCLSLYEQLTDTLYEPVWMIILIDAVILLIALGPIVVFIEILWALRHPSIWLEPPP